MRSCEITPGILPCLGAPGLAAPLVPAGNVSREGRLKALDSREPARAGGQSAAEDDDFIDVGDKKAFKKSWPMLLFLGLIAAAIGVL